MSTDGTLGSLLQGVSQQPPAVRPEGAVSEQINFVSDVVQGLSARPALHEVARITGEPDLDYTYTDATIDGERYIIGFRSGAISMWDMAGNPQTVNIIGSAGAYLSTSMQTYVFDNQMYFVNRDTVVASSPTIQPTAAGKHAHVSLLGGIFSRLYSITLTWADGTVAQATYKTPDGTNAGDAENTRGAVIGGNLITSMQASVPFQNKGGALAQSGNTLVFTATDMDFSVAVSDEEGGRTIRGFTDSVEDIADLSITAPHGTVVRVTGRNEGNEDDYFLRFNSKQTDVVGQGFGTEGVWEEWYDPSEPTLLDVTTMPHRLYKTGANQFEFATADWLGRRVGDSETNAYPDFVGHAIRDINGFQSRLVFVAGPYVAMSRTNEPLDFFKKTVLTEVDTDPISVTSTEEGGIRLDWIIPFDRDLVLMADPGAGQYIVAGNTKLTPSNAALVTTTNFEMKGGAKPVKTGRTIIFPFKSGKFSGIKEFFTNDEVATNGADTITETLDRYITGLVDKMTVSTNFNMVLFKTDDGYGRTVYVYKYLWNNTEKLQSSFSKWVFPEKVVHYFFEGSDLFVVMQAPDGAGRQLIFNTLDLDAPEDAVAEYHISLDRQTTQTVDATFQVSLPYDGASFVQSTGCAAPGREVAAIDVTDTGTEWVYTFSDLTCPEGAQVVCGLKYTRLVKPTRPYARDRNGRPRIRRQLVVDQFLLEYEDTGYIKAVMDARYRAEPMEFVMDWFPLDNDPADPLSRGMRSGILVIPWGERADWSELTLTSDDVRPTRLIELDWTGQVFKGTGG